MLAYNVGKKLEEAGDADAALPYYRRALEYKHDYELALNSVGEAHMRAGRTGHAVRYFRMAVKSAPQYGKGFNNLGVAYTVGANPRMAAKALKRSLMLDPSNAESHANLGATLAGLGEEGQAGRRAPEPPGPRRPCTRSPGRPARARTQSS